MTNQNENNNASNELKKFSWFTERYDEYVHKLEYKIEYLRYREYNILCQDETLTTMFLESILLDVRALMLENKGYRTNYTTQHALQRGTTDENNMLAVMAKKIDDFFESTEIQLEDDNVETLYNAIKFCADKFIAHHDGISEDDLKKYKFLCNYFLEGEMTIIDIVDTILGYVAECSQYAIDSSLFWLTRTSETDMPEDDEEVSEIDKELSDKLFTLLQTCPITEIDKILHLKARGIILNEQFKQNPKLRRIYDEYISKLTSINRMKMIVKIKEISQTERTENHEN